MVFSSIPAYLDPSNWQQQQQQQNYQSGSNTGTGASHNFHPPPPPPPPPPPLQLQPHGLGGGTGSIRPGSMADRARMANLPMPEVALKCPRCESTNTKFCYFNNYSLTQPRHFCKTCRRYWTRGGALRNVPVGGGCRRNKRSNKGSSSGGGDNSKSSPVSSSSGGGGGGGGSGGGASTNNVMIPSVSSGGTMDIIGLGSQFPSMRFMGSNLHNLSNHDQYGNITGDLGINYGGINIPPPLGVSSSDINFFLGNSSSGGSFLSNMEQQWKLQQTQQFPFYATDGLDNNPSVSTYGAMVRPKTTVSSSRLLTLNHDQGSSVKMELNNQDMNLSSRSLGMNIEVNEQFNWTSTGTTTPAWTDLSGFSSSSTSHPL